MKALTLILLFLLMHLYPVAQPSAGVRTTGLLPFLEYGLGDDRLGGAKMTYLDTNIALKVIDSVATDYKVQLSVAHVAWISKQNVKWDTSLHFQPYYLTSSWKVWGDDKYDFVSIALPERLPYKSIQEIEPARIIVDIFGVTSNTNWITQLKSVKEIKNVWYEQIEDDVFRIYIQLHHGQHWGYSISFLKNNLLIRVKRPPILKPKKILVAIDAGHGGTNTGAIGLHSKVNEKEYTLKIAKQLEKKLKHKNFGVLMTRREDVDLSMVDRTLLLRQQDPNLLISIHLNSSGNDNVKGVSTYYRYIGFRSLSQSILDRMLQLRLSNFGNIGAFNFSLSGPTEYPNCLVEVAFLSNAEDEKRILEGHFQKAVAKKIYKGLRDWMKNMGH